MSQNSSRAFATRELRARVIALLGGKCNRCPRSDDLQVHSSMQDGGAHHDRNALDRWRFYLLATTQGKAELLCRSCHQSQTTLDLQARRCGVLAARTLAELPELLHLLPSKT